MRAEEFMVEAVGGNYLYHATGDPKAVLASGFLKAASGPQVSTQAQTELPTVSTTRDWNYASGGTGSGEQEAGVGRHAVIVLDRNAVESRYKTLGTSQSRDIRGQARVNAPELSKHEKMRKIVSKPGQELQGQHKRSYGTAKAGGEFEEAIPVKDGKLPLKGNMVGFWVNPKSEFMKDPEIMNNPSRLELVGPHRFKRAEAVRNP
jgi:hypothetical protein